MSSGDTLEPRENPILHGHEKAESILLEAAASDRQAHAWMFTGPRGIGKATLAYRYARHLLSDGASNGGGLFGDTAADMTMGAEDPVFRRVASGGHADLFSITRSVNQDTNKLRNEIVASDVRAATDFLRRTPGEGGWRVVIVDAADEMNRVAASAILKILEEPPRATVFLLVSHAPGRLLATVRSRCRQLCLQPLATEIVRDLLQEYRPALSADDIEIAATLAEGSIGKGIDFVDAGGLTLYRELIALLSGLKTLDIAAVHALGDRFARANGEDAYRTFIRLLEDWLGRLARSTARGSAVSEIVADEDRAVAVFGGQLAQILEVWENVSGLFAQAERANLDRKQVVVNAFLSMQKAVQL